MWTASFISSTTSGSMIRKEVPFRRTSPKWYRKCLLSSGVMKCTLEYPGGKVRVIVNCICTMSMRRTCIVG